MAENYQNKNEENFDEYRRKMHPEEEKGREVVPTPNNAVKLGYAIFMIIVYVGVGVLFLINFFKWDPSWDWARWLCGIVLIVYGIFRCYRMVRIK